MYGRRELSWQLSGGEWSLHCHGQREPVLRVIQDAVYPGMWRVERPDGSLSDMANLSWARDGAIAIALGILNRRTMPAVDERAEQPFQEGGESSTGSRIIGLPGLGPTGGPPGRISLEPAGFAAPAGCTGAAG
jgi:hypothetical protein